MKKKKILVLGFVLFLVAAVIVMAGGKTEVEGPVEEQIKKTEVLRFTDWQGGNDGILKSYKAIIELFEEENPGYTVEYQQYTVTTYNEFLKPALAGGNAPDLFAVYPGTDAFEVVDSGALIDLKPYIDDEWKSWLGPAYDFKGINIKGGIYLSTRCLDGMHLVS